MRIVLLLLISVVATGCSQAATQSEADCPDTIRLEGIVYTWDGVADEKATAPHESADLADCDDTGEDSKGSVFPDDPTQVSTWTFDGYPPTQVLGVASDDGSFGVFIADEVTPQDRERIHTNLSGG